MSREARDDDRTDVRAGEPPRAPDREPTPARSTRRPDVPIDGLDLPRGERRESVDVGERTYDLRGSETRILATAGAFRVVPSADLDDGRSTSGSLTEDLRRLSEQGLIEWRAIPINHQPTRVVVLTQEGKALLDRHRTPSSADRRQQYHAGLVKPRELAHDAQLYRMYQVEAGRIENRGGRITRVVLDYELKRDYQTFLHRRDRPADTDAQADLRAFAADQRLPVIDDHLELPDLRIEYETADGRSETRDLEFVTENYSRSQIAGKARAGFGLYRAAGAGRSRGGTPQDPHHLDDLS